jgi:RelA/SpoT family (p)ppGpp synthetase
MHRLHEILEKVQGYNPDAHLELLTKAYVFSAKVHRGQTRLSGEPYLTHPLAVAEILADLRMDEVTVASGLLHDTVEDTLTTLEEVREHFGDEVATIVEGLTKLAKVSYSSRREEQAENFRRLVLTMARDVRVVMVKLADRLHNMRTLTHIKDPARRKRIARETMDLYAPLASRIGMEKVKRELEELAFAELNPDGRASVLARQDYLRERGERLVPQIEAELVKTLKDGGLEAQIQGREKTPYSIWRKMQTKNVSFEQLADIMAFRIIVADVAQCYQALGLLHGRYQVLPQRFKDYISVPKPNGYRSLHTGVIGPLGQRIEIQIRTEEMQDQAERGVAAHWIYKHGGPSTDAPQYAWLRSLIEILDKAPNAEEFLEHTKLELFHDQVFCFTPKGKLIALPRQANVIDFAYAVHTDVGNSAVGCKINGKFAPLSSELQNGDEVEVLTSVAQSAPPSAWESLAVTGKARAAIRRATRTAVRDQYAGLGRRIIDRLFARAKIEYADDKLKGALPRLARVSIEDVMASVGRGELKASDVARAMYPDYKEERMVRYGVKRSLAVKLKLKSEPPHPARSASVIPVRGINSDLPVKFAPNGGAVPGDRIVGIVTPGEGITIYPIQSPALKDFEEEPERWLDVRWDIDESNKERFPARVSVTAINAPGSLAEIAQVVAANDANIHTLSMIRTAPDFTEMLIDLEVWDLKHLNRLLSQLKASSAVSDVRRVNG